MQLGEPAALAERDQQLDVDQPAREFLLDPVGQRVDPLTGQCRDDGRVRVPIGELETAVGIGQVGLAQDQQPRHVVGADLGQHLVDGGGHHHQLVLVGGAVDDVEDQIGEPRLLERRAERLDQLVRKLANEADGVGHQVVAAAGPHHPCGRVQRVEQAVPNSDLGAGQRVQQRRLPGVGVARECDPRQVGALAFGPHHRPVRADVDELALQCGDPVAREPAVGLDLGLARSSGADAATEPLQVGPQPAHAREVVLQLGELDLELALGGVRVGGEDIQDHGGPVDHRHPDCLLEIALLPGRQLVVARNQIRVGRRHVRLDLVELAGTDVAVRVRLIAPLDDLADGHDAGGQEQLAQLGELVLAAFGQGSDHQRALSRAGHRSPV